MMQTIAIDDEPLALAVVEALCEQNELISLKQTFTQAREAITYLESNPIDLIFLDIHMPAISGLQLVKQLPANSLFIFTTAFSDYAIESYDLQAIDYLLKPIKQERFNQAVRKAIEYREFLDSKIKQDHGPIYIRADFKIIKIELNEIAYIEGLADYLKIQLINQKPIVARMTMKEMMDKLPESEFIRIHRSYIIPFRRIEYVKGNTLFLDHQAFPIGRTYVEEFFRRYGH